MPLSVNFTVLAANRKPVPRAWRWRESGYLGVRSPVIIRRLTVFFKNNLVENAIRPTAVGKKNWLFIGEARAG